MSEFETTAAIGLPVIAALLGLMVWMRRRRYDQRRHFDSLPVVQLKSLGPQPQDGLLRLRARAETLVEGPLGRPAAAVAVAVFARGYKTVSLIHQVTRIEPWHTKRGTPVRFRGETRVVSAPRIERNVAHDRLPLPSTMMVERGRYHVAERAVAADQWVHVLGRHSKRDGSIEVSPLVEGDFVYVLVETIEEVSRRLVDPGWGVEAAVPVDIGELATTLMRHAKATYIQHRVD